MRLFWALALSFLVLYAAQVSWRSNFEEARREALQTQKTLMVVLVAKEDTAATGMLLQTLLMNQAYITTINTYFVAVLITEGVSQDYPVEMLYTLSYPSFFFLDSHELFTCQPIRGVPDMDRLMQALKRCR